MLENLVPKYNVIVPATASLVFGFVWFADFLLLFLFKGWQTDFIISAISAFIAILIGISVFLSIKKYKGSQQNKFLNASKSLARIGVSLGILFFVLVAALWIFLFVYGDQITA